LLGLGTVVFVYGVVYSELTIWTHCLNMLGCLGRLRSGYIVLLWTPSQMLTVSRAFGSFGIFNSYNQAEGVNQETGKEGGTSGLSLPSAISPLQVFDFKARSNLPRSCLYVQSCCRFKFNLGEVITRIVTPDELFSISVGCSIVFSADSSSQYLLTNQLLKERLVLELDAISRPN